MSKSYRFAHTATAACLAALTVIILAASPLVAAPAGANTRLKSVKGLRGTVEILWDRDGVPHIRGSEEGDAIFGLGYAHATDRLWQMEFLRRAGSGRLAEVLGTSALSGDRLFRTIGVRRAATTAWAQLSGQERRLVQSYVDGINAYLEATPTAALPLEFRINDFKPEPWQPEDVLVSVKVLEWSTDKNWNQELLRTQIAQKLGPEKTAQLMPSYTADGPVILSELGQSASLPQPRRIKRQAVPKGHASLADLLALHRSFVDKLGWGGEGLGSNNWVVSGQRSTTGKPIMAGDPHLPSQIPAVFYLAHLSGGDLDVIGATAPGLPGVLMGHNDRISWCWTNTNADVQDLFIERIDEQNRAEYRGEWEPLTLNPEVIRVRGAADVSLTVRSSRHGPLISDLVNPTGPALALRWTALDPSADGGLTASLISNRARNWDEFKAAFRRSGVHGQNFLYADVQGNIGYLMPGSLPIRQGSDGTTPVPGWTGEFDWKGYVPFAELPQSFNPPQGYLVTANNKVAGDDYPHLVSNGYAAPFRAARIIEMLESKPRHSPEDMAVMQADVVAVQARELLPLMLAVKPTGELARKAVDLLRGWDLRVDGNSAPAAIFEAWYIQLAESVFADELGSPLWSAYSDNHYMTAMALQTALRDKAAWCDNITTDATETCADIVAAALQPALDRMAAAQLSDDPAAWRWERVHQIRFVHQAFDADPRLQPVFSRAFPAGGDKFTVNVASSPRWNDYDQRHLALYRQIVDLSDMADSRWLIAPGQSGDPFDKHYDDLVERWRRVEFRPMRYGRRAIEDSTRSRLLLEPAY